MRRVYHLFPHKIDLDFIIERPFSDVVTALAGMHHNHATDRIGEELIKIEFLVSVADEKTHLVPVDKMPGFQDTLTEEADFQVALNETTLAGEGRRARADNVFLLKIREEGMTCQCFASRTAGNGTLDSFDLKTFLTGALS